ncbi:MAG: dethiobiotin synthase [Fulvivirga sp.]|nr:dethiobiotin synthase [Fulvivirga sp.]
MKYFVTAIDTDSGKTLVSAILARALRAAYWKPIQAGRPTDSDKIREFDKDIQVFEEAFLLNKPASPHDAAAEENIHIDLAKIKLPPYHENLIIEGAGGILVPLNDRDVVIDIAAQFEAEIILVSNLYLGNINHTLLSVEALKARNLPIKGIVFNGPPNNASQQIILKKTGLPELLHVLPEEKINGDIIEKYAETLKKRWHALDRKR